MLPQEVTNLWKRYGIDLTTINPVGPLGQVAEDVTKFTDDPGKLDLTALRERLTPTLGAVAEGIAGGRKNALINFIRGTVPGASEFFAKDNGVPGREDLQGARHSRLPRAATCALLAARDSTRSASRRWSRTLAPTR